MITSKFSAIHELEEQRKLRPARPAQDPQVAVVGMLPGILGDVLAAMSRNKQQLPKSVPGYGALPPGDVVNMHHYTPVKDLEVIDPSKWASRSGPDKNMERAWVEGYPEVKPAMAYLPDYGYKNEHIFGPDPKLIEGAVPGMYNLFEDPLDIIAAARQKAKEAHGGSHYPLMSEPVTRQIMRELQQRGFTGFYRPDAHQGGAAMLFDLVDSRPPGNYPNIAQLRQDLGLPNEVGQSLFPIKDADVAAITTETQPGKSLVPHRYRKYKDEGAAWLLHRDYERLLRNPDTSSVVAKYFDAEAPVYQGQGYFKGQQNPMSGARLRFDSNPHYPLTPDQKQKMDAVAVTEGILRDQDAAAWSRPYDLKPDPTPDDTAVMLESPTFGAETLKDVTKEIEKVPLGQYQWNPTDKKETMADHVVVVPNPNGGPGLFVFKIDDNIPNADFQMMMQQVLDQQKRRLKYTGVPEPEAKWGKQDSGYIGYQDYQTTLQSLPADLQMRAQKALEDLTPAVNAIRDYHDKLRTKPRTRRTP